ncbi:large ribosomal subunit protein uL1m isoform X1 [Haemorhous mexicanus]|uniref:large ribosomal subunit protein uL1m isoform X1 n=1 Tax=Haemorhous mexicanus TaxID=30427 RepID=UPI0028BDCFC5|nr:large ribosomal subunit protein uL1m isoform X1 [Haemorhous mexicanus]
MLLRGRGTSSARSATRQPRVRPEAPLRPLKERAGGFWPAPGNGSPLPGQRAGAGTRATSERQARARRVGGTALGGTPLKSPGLPERFFSASGSEFRGEWFRRRTRAARQNGGAQRPLPVARAAKKDAQKSRQEKVKEHKEKPLPRRRPLMSKPVDDVYLTWLYRRPSYGLEQAVGMLKRFQELDFTHPKQFVYINVFLDMALHKKKKVDPFSSGVALPHRFTDEVNKVLVFTENEQEAEAAREHGAAIVGGVELIKWILEDEIQADFYVAVPAIIPKLIPLRNKLRKKYPSTKRNSLGSDIPRMVQFFRECHEYSVEDESVIKTRIARLDMPTEHIIANLKTIVQDICTFKPSNFDPIVQRLVIRSSTSEGLLLNLDGILPQVEKAEEKEEEDAADEDQQKPAQESVST